MTVKIPHLCVVGHPNKGKSSIVSTLVENDSVQVGVESGTTRSANTFEFRMQGQVLLALTDTPGFQRARQVLAWLEAATVSPAQRPERVKAFLAHPEHATQFPDEVQLLTPIMAGAGILYVVDAGQPVTAADEAEMEILRWTGQPRMAVVNPMTPAEERTEWLTTLSQFFQWVRVFNPLTATMPARQSLLRAMGELSQGWSAPIKDLCVRLERRDQQRLRDVSLMLAQYWCEQMACREPVSALSRALHNSPDALLRQRLDQAEQDWFKQLLGDWGHSNASVDSIAQWDIDQDHLMNTETWYLWGLKQRQLLAVSGAAGAAAGLVVDAGLGGASLMLGAVSGGILGSAGGWWASKQLPGKRLGFLPLVRQKDFVGPVKHPNFPLVVMARAMTFVQQLWLRPHAERTRLALRTGAHEWQQNEQVQLLRWAQRVQSERWNDKQQQALTSWIEQALEQRLQSALKTETEAVWLAH
ncbi:GTPase/DUF3482 domain-containing protein [Salinispirillum sp. LH 10-3-1]|uniref:GTPase/DUF3482 domain-containing protein n=1 Tax=Salinispirillum sp. LH 10-3-1 TaxID=2952525 RepID=A0AB38YCS9_9GAMM